MNGYSGLFITLCMLAYYCWVILHALLSSADFFKINFFSKNSSRNTITVSNSCQRSVTIRPDLGPNCLQTLKGYQHMTKVTASNERKSSFFQCMVILHASFSCLLVFGIQSYRGRVITNVVRT